MALSAIFLLFEVFRRLRKDHKEEAVVKVSLLGLLISGVLLYLANKLGLSGALSVLIAVALSISWFAKNDSWQFWSIIELLMPPTFVALSISYFGQAEFIGCLLVLLSNLYWRNYRNFVWYPSGKAGFIFFADLIVFSLFNLALDFSRNWLVEFIVWTLVLGVGIIGLLSLSKKRKKLKMEWINS